MKRKSSTYSSLYGVELFHPDNNYTQNCHFHCDDMKALGRSFFKVHTKGAINWFIKVAVLKSLSTPWKGHITKGKWGDGEKQCILIGQKLKLLHWKPLGTINQFSHFKSSQESTVRGLEIVPKISHQCQRKSSSIWCFINTRTSYKRCRRGVWYPLCHHTPKLKSTSAKITLAGDR